VVPPGLYLDRVLEVAREELLEECDYEREAANTTRFKKLLSPYTELAVPAVVPQLSSKHVLTTEWMAGLPIDKAAAEGAIEPAERDRIGERLLWLTLSELFKFRFMQTDPNWSNFLYEPRTRQLSMIDFGACREYDAPFAASYLRLVRACADGEAQREAILHHSRELGFLTGEEGRTMLDAHTRAAVLVGRCTPLSPSISPYLLVSPCISLHLPVSARICPYLVSPGISVYLPVYSGISRYLPVFPGISRYLPVSPSRAPATAQRASTTPRCRGAALQALCGRRAAVRLWQADHLEARHRRCADDAARAADAASQGDLLASPEAQRLLPCL